jgi:hypothetical protein
LQQRGNKRISLKLNTEKIKEEAKERIDVVVNMEE